jgi:hypothetical protein
LSEESSTIAAHGNEVFKNAKLIISYIIIMHVDVAVTIDLHIIYDTGMIQRSLAKLRGLLRT